MNNIEHIGKYFLMLKQVFSRPERWRIFRENVLREVDDLGLKSLGIVVFISFFIGGVVAIQTGMNVDSPFIPKSLIGFATKRSVILEFSPTFISVILAGKVGSFITSSIGTMRVTEQIDALEIMGVNSLSYLVLPKIVAVLFFYPFLILISMFFGILGGFYGGQVTGLFTGAQFIEGVQLSFNPYLLRYAMIKTLVFAFCIATIPAYHGYYVKGGALEVGRASTKAVVWTMVSIIVLNFFLTQALLG
ncbi:MAG: MlaE family ABC transporter permease [Flavobacteriaceae bacterium]